MWWPHGQAWFEAHNAGGRGRDWHEVGRRRWRGGLLPDDTATFLLVANTAALATTVRVTLLFETGAAAVAVLHRPGQLRFNVPVVTAEAPASASHMRVPRGTRFSSVIESLGRDAESWSSGRCTGTPAASCWAAGSDLLATKLQ